MGMSISLIAYFPKIWRSDDGLLRNYFRLARDHDRGFSYNVGARLACMLRVWPGVFLETRSWDLGDHRASAFYIQRKCSCT